MQNLRVQEGLVCAQCLISVTTTLLTKIIMGKKMSAESTLENLQSKFAELNELVAKKKHEELTRQTQQLTNYYLTRFLQASSTATRNKVADDYQLLLNTIKEVDEGSLTTDQALSQINRLSCTRQMDLIIENIFRACELLFWACALVTSYAFCLGLGIPLMFFNPLLGLSITLGTSLILLESGFKAFECINQFKPFKALNDQAALEKSTLLFFSQTKPRHQEDEAHQEHYETIEYDSFCAG